MSRARREGTDASDIGKQKDQKYSNGGMVIFFFIFLVARLSCVVVLTVAETNYNVELVLFLSVCVCVGGFFFQWRRSWCLWMRVQKQRDMINSAVMKKESQLVLLEDEPDQLEGGGGGGGFSQQQLMEVKRGVILARKRR